MTRSSDQPRATGSSIYTFFFDWVNSDLPSEVIAVRATDREDAYNQANALLAEAECCAECAAAPGREPVIGNCATIIEVVRSAEPLELCAKESEGERWKPGSALLHPAADATSTSGASGGDSRPEEPAPDFADDLYPLAHRVVAARMSGPATLLAAASLTEWVAVLIDAGFVAKPDAAPALADVQHAVTLTDPSGRIVVWVEYGSFWPVRTALRPAAEDGARWWASCSGLLPPRAVVAASGCPHDHPDEEETGALLVAEGWRRFAYALSGRSDLMSQSWSGPRGRRVATWWRDGEDLGWRIRQDVVPEEPLVIHGSIDIPPAVIAALAVNC